MTAEPEPELPTLPRSAPSGASRRVFAGGAAKVGVGLAVSGAANYAFASIATRAMGPARFADFTVFWGLVFGLGLGVFFPFEQEVSRRVSQAYAAARSSRAARGTAYRLALVTTAGLAVVTLPIAMALAGPGDTLPLWAATSAAFVGLAVAYVSRGGLSGRTLFGRYGSQLGLEGLLRLGAAAALLVAGVGSPWPFAATVPAALLLAVAVTVPRRALPGGPPADPVGPALLARSILPIVVASTAAQSLINLGPVAVTALVDAGDRDRAGSFLAAALIARIPVFAFAAVQAVLIPGLVRAVATHQREAFRRSLGLVLGATVGLGLLGILGCAVAGPALLHLLAGREYDLPASDIAALAAVVALYLVGMVLQPAALSLGRHRAAMLPWVGCAVVFPLPLLLPIDPVHAVEAALLAAAAIAVLGLALVVRHGWRVGWSDQEPEPTR